MTIEAGTGGDNYGSAICAVCDAAANGIVLSEETYQSITGQVRLPTGEVVSRNLITPEAPKTDPIVGTDTTKIGLDYYFKAITKKILDAAGIEVKRKEPKSKELAKEKKRKRIFDLLDLEQGIDEQSKEENKE